MLGVAPVLMSPTNAELICLIPGAYTIRRWMPSSLGTQEALVLLQDFCCFLQLCRLVNAINCFLAVSAGLSFLHELQGLVDQCFVVHWKIL